MMGRRRKHNKHLPTRVYKRGPTYWFEPPNGKPVNLGRTEAEMYRKHAALALAERPIVTLNDLFDVFLRDVLPKRSAAAQRAEPQMMKFLRAGLGRIDVVALRPHHCYTYQNARGVTPPDGGTPAPVRANREMSLLAVVMKHAIKLGLIDANPLHKFEKLKETGRERLPETWELAEVMAAGGPMLRAYVPLKVLLGFRQGDMLGLRLDQLRDDGIHYREGKKGKRRIMEWSDELTEAVARARAVPRPVGSLFLFSTRQGRQYTSDGFRSIWHRAMQKALKEGRLREPFTEHDIRAHTATEAERTESRQRAQELLGHSKPTTTDIYLRDKAPVRVRPLR